MKFYSDELKWIYDHVDDLKRIVMYLDVSIEHFFMRGENERQYRELDKKAHDLAFTFLMLLMGENIPKSLWSVGDYSEMYGLIMGCNDLEVTNDG